MSQRKLHTKSIHGKVLGFAKAMFVALVLAVSLSASHAAAVAPDQQASDPLVAYCASKNLKLNDAAQSGCQDADNIRHTRNIATYHCDANAPSDDKAACVVKNAKSYITKAASSSPKPTDAASFTKAIKKVFADVHGDISQPAAGFNSTTASATDVCASATCTDPAADPNASCDKQGCDFIKKYVNPGINLLTMAFGLIAVISIIIGGIQYTSSAGDPQKVSKAKQRIINTILAIVAYFFLYGFLQFLVPGGIFN